MYVIFVIFAHIKWKYILQNVQKYIPFVSITILSYLYSIHYQRTFNKSNMTCVTSGAVRNCLPFRSHEIFDEISQTFVFHEKKN